MHDVSTRPCICSYLISCPSHCTIYHPLALTGMHLCTPAAAVPQSRVHPKTQTPIFSTVFCGLVSAVLALFVPIGELADLTSLGALFAFCVVASAVMFRYRLVV